MNEVNNIPEGWVETTLEEVVESANTGLDAIKRAPIVEEETGLKCFRIQDASQKKEFTNWGNTLVENKNYNKFKLIEGDILIARTGNTIGVHYLVKQNLKSVFNNGLIRLRANRKIDYKFLYKIIESGSFERFIQSIAYGTSTQPNMQINVLLSFKISLPPLPEQKSIAAILTSFDDKIELLQAQNKTLEELAQTLFKEWFGKYKVGDELPEGWGVGKLSEFGKIICGKTPSKSNEDYFGNDIPFIKIPDMHNKVFILETTDNLSIEGAKSQNNKMLPKNSICISCIATVGLVSITTKKSQTNQQINSIIPNENYFREFLYFTLTKMKNYLNDLGSGGTATLNVNTSTFSNIELVKPKEDIIKDFHKLSNPIFEKVLQNNTQIQTLTKTRDALLPKLMSGEIRVKK